jgi:hypothetical protein
MGLKSLSFLLAYCWQLNKLSQTCHFRHRLASRTTPQNTKQSKGASRFQSGPLVLPTNPQRSACLPSENLPTFKAIQTLALEPYQNRLESSRTCGNTRYQGRGHICRMNRRKYRRTSAIARKALFYRNGDNTGVSWTVSP